jgi:hypothetical protein
MLIPSRDYMELNTCCKYLVQFGGYIRQCLLRALSGQDKYTNLTIYRFKLADEMGPKIICCRITYRSRAKIEKVRVEPSVADCARSLITRLADAGRKEKPCAGESLES